MIFAGIADWADSKEYDVVFMCAELGVSTAGYYAWRVRAPSARASADAALIELIVAAHRKLRGNPGVRRMWAHLTALGHRVSAKRVHRLMRAVDLQGRHPKQWKITTVGGPDPAPAPDLIGRQFTAAAARQVVGMHHDLHQPHSGSSPRNSAAWTPLRSPPGR